MRLTLLLALVIYAKGHNETYEDRRTKLLQDEFKLTLGGTLNLSSDEAKVNKCLFEYKNIELAYAFEHPEYYNMSRHFFTYKKYIPSSKVYKIIEDLPKGAVLHVHDMGILGPDYLMNITYQENLYVCLVNQVQFRFSNKLPELPCDMPWQLMSEVRQKSKNVTEFDNGIRKLFSLVVENPDIVYPSINDSWNVFMNYFITVSPLLSYRPVWEQYFYDALKKFREHNIMYVEVRSILPNLYELDGRMYQQIVTAKAYRKAINKFMRDYPDFIGAKLIFAPRRKVDSDAVAKYISLAKQIKLNMPEIFAGFDLVGQEDKGTPLKDFIPVLEGAAKDLNYFFHAGETDWYGSLTDENLIDAILLGAKRIGHAYALPKHPLLMKEVVKNKIGLEVNVVSNNVLSLVRDVRNHPLSVFFANDLPVVLSSDDPGAWEADPITDDFYIAFMAVASKHSDLRMLKKLALNSLEHSALEKQAKVKAIDEFNKRWDEFVKKFDCSAY